MGRFKERKVELPLIDMYVPYLLVRRTKTFMSTLISDSEIEKVVIFY